MPGMTFARRLAIVVLSSCTDISTISVPSLMTNAAAPRFFVSRPIARFRSETFLRTSSTAPRVLQLKMGAQVRR